LKLQVWRVASVLMKQQISAHRLTRVVLSFVNQILNLE
jgi:hypothetical protein